MRLIVTARASACAVCLVLLAGCGTTGVIPVTQLVLRTSGGRDARKRAQWLGVTMDPALLHAGMPPGVKQTLGSQSALRARASKRTSATSATSATGDAKRGG